MSSISKAELIAALSNYPDDAEVIFELHEWRYDGASTAIAFINGIEYEEKWNEIRLRN